MLKNDIRYIIKRVLVAVLIAFILFFLKTNKILAATCPTTTNTFDARYSDIESDVYYYSFGSLGSYVGTATMGNAITQPSTSNPYGNGLTELSLKLYTANGFTAGNTYNVVVRVNTSSSDVAKYYKKYATARTARGGTTTSNLSESSIAAFSLDKIEIDESNDKVFYIYYSFVPQSTVNYVWFYAQLIKINYHYTSTNYMNNGNVVVRFSGCSYSEGSNSYIQQNTIEIIKQTKEIIKLFDLSQEELDYLQDDTDAAVDVSGMTGITGLLPPGPLDSLLSIPITILNIFIDSTSGTCSPFTFTFVFNEEFTLPCFDVFWNQVPTSLMLFMSDLPAVILFIMWAKSIYKRVERATSFESSVDDEWGGV